MNYLLENYYNFCKARFSQYGFKKKGSVFVRTVNDVMQIFVIEKLKSGRACRVGFAIIPFCLRIEKEYVSGGVYLRNLRGFEPAHWAQYDHWEYDPKSENSMDFCVKEIIRYLENYLLPLFKYAKSCEAALPELIKLERRFNDNRVEGLKADGLEDKAGPGAELLLSDCVKYYMALKIGDYDFALKSCQAQFQRSLDAYNLMVEGKYLTEIDRIRREKNLANLRDEINRLHAKDIGYFQRLLEENEAYSIQNLKGII